MNTHLSHLINIYNSCVRKLKRLSLRRDAQSLFSFRKKKLRLQKRLNALATQIGRLKTTAKKAALPSIVAIGSCISANEMTAQVSFELQNRVPFKTDFCGAGGTRPDLVDIDADNDLDVFTGRGVRFFENTGTASTPLFDECGTLSGFGIELMNGGFGDIDGDGDLDRFDGIEWQENTGSASNPAFAPIINAPFSSLTSVHALILQKMVDIDNDGDLDMFGVDHSFPNPAIAFAENKGTPTAPAFDTIINYTMGLTYTQGDWGMDLTDIDGDGDIDIFNGEYNQPSIYFIENIGTPTAPFFAPEVSASYMGLCPCIPHTDVAVGFGDLDGDGDVDALMDGFYGRQELYRNNGTPSDPDFREWRPDPVFNLPGDCIAQFIDVDNDGDLDALCCDNGEVAYYQNTGTVTNPDFAPAVINPFGIPAGNCSEHIKTEFADVDMDGDFDFLGNDGSGSGVRFFHNTGTISNPAFTLSSAVNWPDIHIAQMVDIDGDNDMDLFTSNLSNELLLYENTGTGSTPAFASPVTDPFSLWYPGGFSYLDDYDFADVDGDGDIDFFMTYSDLFGFWSWIGLSYYYENTGSPTNPVFQYRPFVDIPDWGGYRIPFLGDLDGDNDSDLFIWDDGGTFYFENQLYDSTSFCDSVTGLSTINVLPMKAKLTWDSIPGASKYRVFYKEAGVPGSPSTKNSVDNIRVVNGLSPSTTYQARVKALCLGLGWSAFSAPIFFTTPIMRESGFCHADVPADIYSYGKNIYVQLDEPRLEISAAITVFDMLGKQVHNLETSVADVVIDFSHKPAGNYIVQWQSGNAVMRKQVFIF